MATRHIALDCNSFSPRPDTYIVGVLEGTGLLAGDPVSTMFGNWEWEFEISDNEWDNIVPTIRERITNLYNAGSIRYGSWG